MFGRGFLWKWPVSTMDFEFLLVPFWIFSPKGRHITGIYHFCLLLPQGSPQQAEAFWIKKTPCQEALQKLWRSLLDDMYVLDARNNSLQSSWCPSLSQIPLFLAMFPFPPSHFFCTSASILQSWDIWPDHHSVFSLFCPLEVLVKTSEFLLFFNHH